MNEIVLQNPNRYPEARARTVRPFVERLVGLLEGTLQAATDRRSGSASISFGVRFVSDREMRRVNRSYRQIDKSTDVLSFPGDPNESDEDSPEDYQEPARHWGDVLISVPYARRQANQRGHSCDVEIRILLLHGVLHCLGYDHESDAGEMDREEDRFRRELGLPGAL